MNAILQSEEQKDAIYVSDRRDINLFHEELLCTLKLHDSGLLEVTPGFSKFETEDSDDDEIFVSNEGLEKRSSKGAKLTTFTFATPMGSVYQYTLKWVDFLIDQTKLESLALREMDEHYRLLSQHRKTVLSHLNERIELMHWLVQSGDEQMIQIEFVSAHGFSPQWNHSSLSIDYDISIPKCWKYSVCNCGPGFQTHSIVGSTMLTKAAYYPISCWESTKHLHTLFLFALFELVS